MEIVKESIFVSALRSFCKMFFAVCGLFIAFILFSSIYSAFSGHSLIEEKTTMEILSDAEGNRNVSLLTAPAILQLNIHGIIGEPQALDAESIENILLDSRIGLLKGDRVKGILLHFNTPGGSAFDSDTIYRMLKTYKEKYQVPIFAYVEGMCASGGMYIAASADKVFAAPSSAIGSVGVITGPFLNFSEVLGKIGIQSRTLTEGLYKDMLNPLRPWKEGEDASLKNLVAFLYERFIHVVTEARPQLNKEKLLNEYGAQIYDCVHAQQFGYIDVAMSSRNEALLALLEQAHIDQSKPYQVVQLTPQRSWLSQLIKNEGGVLSGKIEHRFDVGQPKIKDHFAYLYTGAGV